MKKLFIESPALGKELINISVTIIDNTIFKIEKNESGNDILVHDLRKAVKNLRAVLKLLKNKVGTEFYKKHNFILRDLNRRSAALRNYSALKKLSDSIAEKSTDDVVKEKLNVVTAKIKIDNDEIISKTDFKVLFGHSEKQLNKYKLHLVKFDIDGNRFSHIKSGLLKLYTDGKKGLEYNVSEHSENTLHEWRKVVKDLYYCFYCLTPIWKEIITPYSKQLKSLTKLLGKIHDYDELTYYINSKIENRSDIEELFSLIEKEKRRLIKKSLILGKKLFAENPDRFIYRIKSYYSNYKSAYS